MKSGKKTVSTSTLLRELTDRDLNEITKGVGDQARAQTIAQKERLKSNLQQELTAVRTAFAAHERKHAKT